MDAGTLFLEGEPVVRVDEIKLPGRHNLENCLAAGAAALARGVGREAVAEGLRTFAGVAHRLEMAGMVAGVTYVNDSKATNVEATLTALNAYPQNTHLILGGRDKHSDYRPVARACARGCKAVYLIGEATPLIESAFAEVRERRGRARRARGARVRRPGDGRGRGLQGGRGRRRSVVGSGLRELRSVQELRRAGRALRGAGQAVGWQEGMNTATFRPFPARSGGRVARPRADDASVAPRKQAEPELG